MTSLTPLLWYHFALYYDATMTITWLSYSHWQHHYTAINLKVDMHGAHFVGYFSKEKESVEGNNLVCSSLLSLHFPSTMPLYPPSTMTVLPLLLWRYYPRYYDVTTPSTMTLLPLLLWRYYPFYYDVTTPATMPSLILLLWRHYPRYYNVTTMTLLPPLIWRH